MPDKSASRVERPEFVAILTDQALSLKAERNRLIRIAFEDYGHTMDWVVRHLR
jgi:hypothetical protein